MTNTATEKQIEYIKALIAERQTEAYRAALQHRPMGSRSGDLPDGQRVAYELVRDFYGAIVVPAEMSQARASRWIDLLRNTWATAMVRIMDDPKIAESLGITGFIAEHEVALDSARKAL